MEALEDRKLELEIGKPKARKVPAEVHSPGRNPALLWGLIETQGERARARERESERERERGREGQ